MERVLITGADRGLGFALAEVFLREGWEVFAGQYMPEWGALERLRSQGFVRLHVVPLHVDEENSVRRAKEEVHTMTDTIDLLVNCAGIFPQTDSPETIRSAYRVNTLGPLCVTEVFLPLMERGRKRICMVSSEAGSIALSTRMDSFAYCMSKTALNMASRLLFNRLQPQGYTFRLYHPGWMKTYMMGIKSAEGDFEPEESARKAFAWFTQEEENEEILALKDIRGEYWPF